MRSLRNKTNAGNFRKSLAFLAVAMFSFFAIGIATPSDAAVANGISYDIYTGYTSATSVRPMDNPSVVSNYNFCKSGTFSTVNTNWGGGNIEGCGGDYILIHYKGYLYSETAQTLYFRGYSDDGFHAKVGDTVVVNNWRLQGCGVSGTGEGVTFNAGEYKPIDIWFFEHGGGACSMLYYSNSAYGSYSPVPASMYTTSNYQAAIFSDSIITNEAPSGATYSSAVSASASGIITYSISDGSLPPGLSLNSATGEIAGTPDDPGAYTFRIKAQSDDNGVVTSDYTEYLSITVGSPVTGGLGLVNRTLWLGDTVSNSAVFSGYPTPTVIKESGDIPPGLSVSSNGTISGTPTESGTYTFALRGYNFVNSVTTESYTYTVQAAPAFVDDSNYTSTMLYGSQVSLSSSATGASLTYSLYSGELPAGLSLNSETGVVSGRTTESGVFTYRIQVANNSGSATSQTSTITVRKAPTFTNTGIVSRLNKGVPYTFDFKAPAYPAPTYSVVSGALPTGMALSASRGELTGTPTVGGSFTFTIRASNEIDNAEIEKTVTVSAAPRAVDVNLLLEILCGSSYADAIEYESYPAPSYSVVEGALPPGLLLGESTGSVIGIPTRGGLFNFKLRVTNGEDSSTTDNYALTVNQVPVKLDDTIVEKTELGKSYNDAVTATGYPLPSYSVSSGSLPAGIKLNSATGALTGTPTETGTLNFTIEAKNSVGALDLPLTISVESAPVFLKGGFPQTLGVGETVSEKVSATGFPLPTFRIVSGSLPDGLSLDAITGTISGTATNAGTFSFVVAATNEV